MGEPTRIPARTRRRPGVGRGARPQLTAITRGRCAGAKDLDERAAGADARWLGSHCGIWLLLLRRDGGAPNRRTAGSSSREIRMRVWQSLGNYLGRSLREEDVFGPNGLPEWTRQPRTEPRSEGGLHSPSHSSPARFTRIIGRDNNNFTVRRHQRGGATVPLPGRSKPVRLLPSPAPSFPRSCGAGPRCPLRRPRPALGVTMAVAMAVCTAPSSVIRQALMANASPVATARAPSVRDVALPITEANDYSGSLGVLAGQIVVGDNSGGNVCRLAIVQPVTLTVLSEQSTSCNDPRLLGEDVMPVESVPSVGSPLGVVRISVRNKATGAIHLGPVVMRYENCSDCRPEWAYGGASLWLYDVGTPSMAEVLRISLSTGAVLSTVKTPALSRVLLAPGTNGLWFAQSLEGGWPSGKPRPALLYFVGNNATRPDVIAQPGDYVNWLVAAGTAAWANVQTGPNTEDITSFPTPTSLPVTVTVAATNANVPTNIGEGPLTRRLYLTTPGSGSCTPGPGGCGLW